MKCKEKRNLFDLFKVFTCNECEYFFSDEEIPVGGNIVNIYYLNHNCLREELDDFYIANNKSLKIFLKDIIYDTYKINNLESINSDLNQKSIYIWLTREENENLKDMKMIYDLLSFENNLHILVF